MLRYLPNALTFLRLLLAFPLGLLIVQQDYPMALAVGFVAGLTDALDGYTARRLGYLSQFGAALDPVADKVLVLVTFFCLAAIELIPLWLAALVIGRDLVIVAGALCYRLLVGPIKFAASALSKFNMLTQICFCILALAAQLLPSIPEQTITLAIYAVVLIAVLSGLDYIFTWSRKARQAPPGSYK